MASTRLKSRHISSCKFSPHIDGIISCSTSLSEQPYGPGSVDIFRLNSENKNLDLINAFAWNNAILETCWSPTEQDVLVGGCADNSIQLWKLWNSKKPSATLLEHTAPVTSVEWRDGGQLLSSSLDGYFNVWDPELQLPVVKRNLGEFVLQSTLCPFSYHIVASVLDRKQLRITDYRRESEVAWAVSSKFQMLCCDWSPHNPNNILVSTSEGSVGKIDLRRVSDFEDSCGLRCHRGPVRRARWLSAHNGLAVSVGFDGTTVISDVLNASVLERIRHHSHVVYDVDCSPFHPNLLVDCSWDSLLHVFEPLSLSIKPLFTPFQNKL